MAAKRSDEDESPSTVIKRTFDIPNYNPFKEALLLRDQTPALFIRRVVNEYLEKTYFTVAYLRPDNQAFLKQYMSQFETKDMQYALENIIDEYRKLKGKK